MLMESPDKSSSSYQLQSPGWSSSKLPPSVTRLWRPAAQRNLRNQWSKLASYKSQWVSSSSSGRSHATSLVNTDLSLRYIPSMELGVLSDMLDLRKKASAKLLKQLELYRSKLLSSYRDLVAVLTHMVNTSRSMRCYVKGTSSSPLVQFSCSSEDKNDAGDGGGTPVFAFWSISSFEQLADELVLMFTSELSLKVHAGSFSMMKSPHDLIFGFKDLSLLGFLFAIFLGILWLWQRLLVVELFTNSCEAQEVNEFCWLNELYPGEFDDLRKCNLFSEDTGGPVYPRLMKGKSDMPPLKLNSQPNHENLQVYLTTWLEELNIDTHRIDEMFAILEEEMHVHLS
uniref:Uncharacterized protein n=1 Tax=Salix viminalis TaxID=40686 RepID=A0A6N2NFQ3_SALVM